VAALASSHPAVDVSYLADCTSVAFDSGRSSDPKGGRLDFTWFFGDGATAKGQAVRHDYAKPGHYSARLDLRGSSEQVGDAAALDVDVFVKRPPVAKAKMLPRVAAGETVAFDGSASSPGDGAIKRMVWSFNDGVELVGPVVQRAFTTPGRYDATLRIEDTTGRVCNSAIDQQTIVVNAQPVAVAGENKRAAVGDAVAFDGARSYDTDGTIIRYQWDFGDGTRAEGATAQHAYAAPSTYTVTLAVTDDAGVANSTASDRLTVLVHAPPVAVAGPDITAAIG
jgi:PKD repeat protein